MRRSSWRWGYQTSTVMGALAAAGATSEAAVASAGAMAVRVVAKCSHGAGNRKAPQTTMTPRPTQQQHKQRDQPKRRHRGFRSNTVYTVLTMVL